MAAAVKLLRMYPWTAYVGAWSLAGAGYEMNSRSADCGSLVTSMAGGFCGGALLSCSWPIFFFYIGMHTAHRWAEPLLDWEEHQRNRDTD